MLEFCVIVLVIGVFLISYNFEKICVFLYKEKKMSDSYSVGKVPHIPPQQLPKTYLDKPMEKFKGKVMPVNTNPKNSKRPIPPPPPQKRLQMRGGHIGNVYSTPLTGNTYYDNDEEYRRQSDALDMMNTISFFDTSDSSSNNCSDTSCDSGSSDSCCSDN